MIATMRAEWVQRVGIGLLVLVPLGALLLATRVSSSFSFVRQDGPALWIASPDPVSTGVVAAPWAELPFVEFSRELELDPASGPIRLHVEALRGFELEWNGRLVTERRWDEGSWRRPRIVEVGPGLAEGANRLRVRVRNPHGPPLLRLRGEGAGVQFASDESWEVRREGSPARRARVADDTLRAASALIVPPLGRALGARGPWLAFLLVLGGALAWTLARAPAATSGVRPEVGLGLLVVGLWVVLFGRAVQLPAYAGFDGPDHLDYVHLVREEGRIPWADEGPQTYQPPLFYVLSAGLLALLPSAPERLVLRVVPFACGLVQVAAAVWLAQLLFPGDRVRRIAAALAAGFLPLHLYMAAYLNNQPLSGALAALALPATVRLLLGAGVGIGASAALGGLLGLSVLAKTSGLLLVPIVALFLAVRRYVADGAGLLRSLAPAAAVATGAAVVCGWFFLRNQLRFGEALIGNWDVPGSPVAWWQHPGFHTPAYYLRFGEVLYRPFFASFDSFWDGLYSTLWGDGLLGGVAGWAQRHPFWDYEWMASVYVLALPASALCLFGFARLGVDALRGPDLRRRMALTLLTSVGFLTVFAALFMTLVLPAYSMTKASYLLSAAPVLSLALAEGWSRADAALEAPHRRWLRVLLHAWTVALLVAIALSFVG